MIITYNHPMYMCIPYQYVLLVYGYDTVVLLSLCCKCAMSAYLLAGKMLYKKMLRIMK